MIYLLILSHSGLRVASLHTLEWMLLYRMYSYWLSIHDFRFSVWAEQANAAVEKHVLALAVALQDKMYCAVGLYEI